MKFLENKYTKWYYEIIENSKALEGEKHHIIPKSLGGNDSKDNIKLLSYREHFICHLLLTKMVTGDAQHKMCWALHKLSYSGTIRSKSYELVRKIHVWNLKKRDYNDPTYIKKLSNSIKDSWVGSDERRVDTSKTIKRYYQENKDVIDDRLRNMSKYAARKSAEVKSKRIEYKGEIYLGWKQLRDKTGVSKHLYTKYYLNGVDPEFRINTNGPIKL